MGRCRNHPVWMTLTTDTMLPTVGWPCQAASFEGFDVLPPNLPCGLSCFECHDSSHFSGVS